MKLHWIDFICIYILFCAQLNTIFNIRYPYIFRNLFLWRAVHVVTKHFSTPCYDSNTSDRKLSYSVKCNIKCMCG